ncbi:hypothetical protein HPP92_002953 [Vanilla planifolia]|uniref:Uncharacterized protein n=1 Tax=Vanilla planifolia TaxID=51239 RepID=A0A835S2P9_VANPL|nr:hypothetical protein HPP92_002953 [Vanilla planifolia]
MFATDLRKEVKDPRLIVGDISAIYIKCDHDSKPNSTSQKPSHHQQKKIWSCRHCGSTNKTTAKPMVHFLPMASMFFPSQATQDRNKAQTPHKNFLLNFCYVMFF